MFVVGLAILIVIVISTSMIEKSLKSIEKQNATIVEILKEIRDQKWVLDGWISYIQVYSTITKS